MEKNLKKDLEKKLNKKIKSSDNSIVSAAENGDEVAGAKQPSNRSIVKANQVASKDNVKQKQNVPEKIDEDKTTDDKKVQTQKEYEAKEKKTSALKLAFNIISDILFVGVMLILIIFMAFGFGNLSDNKVPSFFGTSYVRILSGSMKNSGFNKGDVAVIRMTNVSEIKDGDIIAFYYCSLKEPDMQDRENVDSSTIKDFSTNSTSYDTQIVFHKIADSYVDDEGYLWFKTYGTSNVNSSGDISYDTNLVRADYVIGVYQDTFLADLLTFVSSSTGIIVVVVIPSCIVLFLLLLNIIQIYDQMVTAEKKRREQEFAKIIEMQDYEKNKNKDNQNDDIQIEEVGKSLDENIENIKKLNATLSKKIPTPPNAKAVPPKANITEKEIKPNTTKQDTTLTNENEIKPSQSTIKTENKKEDKDDTTKQSKTEKETKSTAKKETTKETSSTTKATTKSKQKDIKSSEKKEEKIKLENKTSEKQKSKKTTKN